MRLITLGRLRLEGSELTRPKPLLLLTYLRLEGATSRRVLADLFFPDTKDPRDSLATAVRQIRLSAPCALDSVADELVAAKFWCDASEAIATNREGDPRRIVELHTGAFAEGLDVTLGLELEEWLFSTRERLASLASDAANRLATGAAATGDDAGARELEAQADRIARHAAEATARTGPRSESPRRLRVRLPRPRTSFVGREREIASLLERLRDPEVRILTLCGIGGIGKTRLAIELVRRAVAGGFEEFRDAAAFVPLRAVDSEAGVVRQLATALSFATSANDGLSELEEPLTGLRALLVLDDVGHLDFLASGIASLAARRPDATFLLTSRERLGLAGEVVWEVAGLEIDGEANASSAVHLFIDRAGRVAGRGGAPEPTAAIRKICRDLGGHPLAIELAASLTRAATVETIQGDLAARLEAEVSTAPDRPARHRTPNAAIRGSWDALPDHARKTLLHLAVFRGGFTPAAAATVSGSDWRRLLHLVDRSLLTHEPSGRFDMHPLVRRFLLAELERNETLRERARARHSDHYRRMLLTLRGEAASDSDALERAEIDFANIASAFDHGFDVGASWGIAELEAFRYLIERRGRFREGAERIRSALAGRPLHGTSEVDAALRVHLAGTLYRLGEMRSAEDLLGTAVSAAPSDDRSATLAEAHLLLAAIRFSRGSYSAAIEGFGRALALSTDPLTRGALLHNLGEAYAALGAFGVAFGHLEHALELHLDLDDGHRIAADLAAMGAVRLNQGELAEAQRLLERALDRATRLDHRTEIARARGELAWLHIARGGLDEALQHLTAGLPLAEEMGALELRLPLLTAKVWIESEQGERVCAGRSLRKVVDLADERSIWLPRIAVAAANHLFASGLHEWGRALIRITTTHTPPEGLEAALVRRLADLYDIPLPRSPPTGSASRLSGLRRALKRSLIEAP